MLNILNHTLDMLITHFLAVIQGLILDVNVCVCDSMVVPLRNILHIVDVPQLVFSPLIEAVRRPPLIHWQIQLEKRAVTVEARQAVPPIIPVHLAFLAGSRSNGVFSALSLSDIDCDFGKVWAAKIGSLSGCPGVVISTGDPSGDGVQHQLGSADS